MALIRTHVLLETDAHVMLVLSPRICKHSYFPSVMINIRITSGLSKQIIVESVNMTSHHEGSK